jgi:hypothetical protein
MLCAVFCFLLIAGGCDCDDDDDNDEAADDETPDDDSSPGDDDEADDDDNNDDDDAAAEIFRIAVISDANIVADNLLQWNENLVNVVAAVNNEPGLDFLVILGDLGVRFFEWWWEDYHADYNPEMTWEYCLNVALEILSDLEIPYYFVPGDKDYADIYQINWGFDVQWAEREQRTAGLRTRLGAAYPGTEAWYSFKHKGVRFFAGNSMAGDRWQDGFGIPIARPGAARSLARTRPIPLQLFHESSQRLAIWRVRHDLGGGVVANPRVKAFSTATLRLSEL